MTGDIIDEILECDEHAEVAPMVHGVDFQMSQLLELRHLVESLRNTFAQMDEILTHRKIDVSVKGESLTLDPETQAEALALVLRPFAVTAALTLGRLRQMKCDPLPGLGEDREKIIEFVKELHALDHPEPEKKRGTVRRA